MIGVSRDPFECTLRRFELFLRCRLGLREGPGDGGAGRDDVREVRENRFVEGVRVLSDAVDLGEGERRSSSGSTFRCFWVCDTGLERPACSCIGGFSGAEVSSTSSDVGFIDSFARLDEGSWFLATSLDVLRLLGALTEPGAVTGEVDWPRNASDALRPLVALVALR